MPLIPDRNIFVWLLFIPQEIRVNEGLIAHGISNLRMESI